MIALGDVQVDHAVSVPHRQVDTLSGFSHQLFNVRPCDRSQMNFLLNPGAKLQKAKRECIFFRDRIALSLGLQQLDLFLSRILSTLFQQSYKLPKDKLRLLLLYDPQIANSQ